MMRWELFLTRLKLFRNAMKSQMFEKFNQREKERKEVFLIKTKSSSLRDGYVVSHNKLIYFVYYQEIPEKPWNYDYYCWEIHGYYS